MTRLLLALATLATILVATPAQAQTAQEPSEITVYARGRLGSERASLVLNGSQRAEWNLSDQNQAYTWESTGDITINELKIQAAATGWPQSVIIDRIEIDGQTYQAESGTTLSNGSWNSATGCAPGYKQSEWLQCADGFLVFESVDGLQLDGPGNSGTTDAPIVIFDTDMGVDIDDAMALAALHAYADAGEAEIAAVTISRNSSRAAEYTDMLNTAYGRPDIPIGTYRGTTDHDTTEHWYTDDLVESNEWNHDIDPLTVPDAVQVMRQVLLDSPNDSVVIVQVGFSTNTSALMNQYPQLVANKVRLLSMMGGRNNNQNFGDFNIETHIPSATNVFANFPNDIIQSEADMGEGLVYPLEEVPGGAECSAGASLLGDSYRNSVLPWHPVNGDSYDMYSWDVTSVIAAIEPGEYWTPGPRGNVSIVNNKTVFTPAADGNLRSLGKHWEMTAAEKARVIDRMVELINVHN